MAGNWKEEFLIWLKDNKIEVIETIIDPVEIRSINGLHVYHMPSSITLKFFNDNDECVYKSMFTRSHAKLICDEFDNYKRINTFPIFVEIDE